MIQSQISQNTRLALTDVILLAKARKDLSFAQIAEGTGLHEAFVTAALLGQHPLPANAAQVVADTLGLDADAVLLLQSIPLRGSIGNGIRFGNDGAMYVDITGTRSASGQPFSITIPLS